MGSSRKPGPIGRGHESKDLNDGTLIRALSSRPGLVSGGDPSTKSKRQSISRTAVVAKPSLRSAATIMQVLQQGNRGSEVQKLQRQLNVRMQPSPQLVVDGIFGPLTQKAVQQYQKGVAIAGDGIVGKQTWYHLLKGDKVTVAQPPIVPPRPPLAKPVAASTPMPLHKAPQLPPPPPPPPPPVESIWEWSTQKKLREAIDRVPARLPGRAKVEFMALLEPEALAISLAIIAGFCLLSGGTALVLGILILGFDITLSLASAVQTAALAATEEELNEAADELAHVILAVGVAAFLKGVGKIAQGLKGGGKGGPKPPPKPQQRTGYERRPPHQSEQPTPKPIGPTKTPIESQLDAMYAKAPNAKAEIDALAEMIAKETGGRVAKAPLKGRERALEKALEYEKKGGDASNVKDIARNTIVVEQSQYDKAVALLEAQGAKVKKIDASSNELGYSGTNAVVKTKAGIPAEIQVNTPEMIYAKENPEIARAILGEEKYAELAAKIGVPGGRGHQLYEKARSLPEGDPRVGDIAAESREYYNHVRSAGGK